MAAKAVAFMLVITLMVSTFTVRANAFDVAASGRSLLRLNFFSHADVSSSLQTASPVSSSFEAPAPSANNGGQSWGSWFDQKMGSVTNMMSVSRAAPAPAPAA